MSKTKFDIKNYTWIPALILGFVPTMIFDITKGNLPWTTIITFLTESTKQRTWGHNLGEWYYYIFNSPAVLGLVKPGLFLLWLLFFIIGIIFVISEIKGSKKNKILLITIFSILHVIAYSFLTPRWFSPVERT